MLVFNHSLVSFATPFMQYHCHKGWHFKHFYISNHLNLYYLIIQYLIYYISILSSCTHIFIMAPMHSFSNSKCVWCCFTIRYKISGASLISRCLLRKKKTHKKNTLCWYSIIRSSHSLPHSCNCHLLTFFITYICYILIILM